MIPKETKRHADLSYGVNKPEKENSVYFQLILQHYSMGDNLAEEDIYVSHSRCR